MNDLTEYKNIFSEFTEIIKQLCTNDITKRSLFFLNEIIIILNDFSNVNIQKKTNQFNMSSENTENLKNVFIEKMKEHNKARKEQKAIFPPIRSKSSMYSK